MPDPVWLAANQDRFPKAVRFSLPLTPERRGITYDNVKSLSSGGHSRTEHVGRCRCRHV